MNWISNPIIKKTARYTVVAALLFGTTECRKKDEDTIPDIPSCGGLIGINLFSLDQDRALGAQVDSSILATPSEYPILDPTTHAAAYTYLRGIRDKILASDKIRYRDDFTWDLRIINDPNTLNAFVTPGGYIYVYTGLIKYLDTEDDLAGVMGHEIAHADRRHGTLQLSQSNIRDVALQFLLGNDPGALVQIANSIIGLSYSRCMETESDLYSVDYLASTGVYSCVGTASFFEKLSAQNTGGGGPEFLSTHPNPDNRVEAINERANQLSCNKTFSTTQSAYTQFKNSLP